MTASLSLLMLASSAHAVISLPVGIYSDAQWEADPTGGIAGRYRVEASNQNVSNEQWELPVADGKWTTGTDGGVDYLYSGSNSNFGEYYAYGDLTKVELTETTNQWKIKYSVAGDFKQAGDKSFNDRSIVGLEAKYYIYFGQGDTHYAFWIESPGTSSAGSSVSAKLYEPDNNGQANVDSPFGNSITTTGEGGGGFNNQVTTSGLSATTLYDPGNDVYDLELIYNFDQGVISKNLLENLDYYYLGTAVSNPSAPSELFLNDHYPNPQGNGGSSPESDTLWIQNPTDPLANPNYQGPNTDGQGPELVPEPSTYALLAGMIALISVGIRRRPRK